MIASGDNNKFKFSVYNSSDSEYALCVQNTYSVGAEIKLYLLIDTSSSMLKHLVLLNEIIGRFGIITKPTIITFNSKVEVLKCQSLTTEDFSAGTNISGALDFLKSQILNGVGITQVVLISDGDATYGKKGLKLQKHINETVIPSLSQNVIFHVVVCKDSNKDLKDLVGKCGSYVYMKSIKELDLAFTNLENLIRGVSVITPYKLTICVNKPSTFYDGTMLHFIFSNTPKDVDIYVPVEGDAKYMYITSNDGSTLDLGYKVTYNPTIVSFAKVLCEIYKLCTMNSRSLKNEYYRNKCFTDIASMVKSIKYVCNIVDFDNLRTDDEFERVITLLKSIISGDNIQYYGKLIKNYICTNYTAHKFLEEIYHESNRNAKLLIRSVLNDEIPFKNELISEHKKEFLNILMEHNIIYSYYIPINCKKYKHKRLDKTASNNEFRTVLTKVLGFPIKECINGRYTDYTINTESLVRSKTADNNDTLEQMEHIYTAFLNTITNNNNIFSARYSLDEYIASESEKTEYALYLSCVKDKCFSGINQRVAEGITENLSKFLNTNLWEIGPLKNVLEDLELIKRINRFVKNITTIRGFMLDTICTVELSTQSQSLLKACQVTKKYVESLKIKKLVDNTTRKIFKDDESSRINHGYTSYCTSGYVITS